MHCNQPLSRAEIINLELETALAVKLIGEGVTRSDDQQYHFAEWRENDVHISAKQLPQVDGAFLHSVVVSNYRFRWNAMVFEVAAHWTDIEFSFIGDLDDDFLAYLASAV